MIIVIRWHVGFVTACRLQRNNNTQPDCSILPCHSLPLLLHKNLHCEDVLSSHSWHAVHSPSKEQQEGIRDWWPQLHRLLPSSFHCHPFKVVSQPAHTIYHISSYSTCRLYQVHPTGNTSHLTRQLSYSPITRKSQRPLRNLIVSIET